MFILDTNVLSEAVKPSPDPKIGVWLGAQPRDDLYTTSLAQADILYAVWRLPPGSAAPTCWRRLWKSLPFSTKESSPSILTLPKPTLKSSSIVK